MDFTIIAIRERPEYKDRAADYFSSKWGIERGLYDAAISDGIVTENPLPRWYLALRGDEIIGAFGLIENDFMTRRDLMPWLCALYVEEGERGRGLGGALLERGREEAGRLGFKKLYLCTDHTGYYERYGWRFFGMEEEESGGLTRVYETECGAPDAAKWLDGFTDEDRARLFPIVLRAYDPEWPRWFEREREELLRYIGAENVSRIIHYGSTAVPGLSAKPTVDILLELRGEVDPAALKSALPYPEYIPQERGFENEKLMFYKGYTAAGFAERVYHIHVRHCGHRPPEGEWDEVVFRDWLIGNPGTAAEYAALKTALKERFERDRDGYTSAKGEFIRAVTERARESAQ
jgi:GrpB-like predicted nucleotidyltransferase (UPF0157 family)/GNAT superfamily N-acetyltransferase